MVTIIIIITIICILLILVILAQNSKGGGLSSQFGGSSTSQLIGVKKTGDFLERFTWGLAIALFVFTLSTDFFITSNDVNIEGGGPASPNIERATDRTIVSPQDLNLDGANTTDQGTTEGDANGETPEEDPAEN